MRKLRKIISPTLTAALLAMQLAPGFLLPKKAQAIITDGAPAIDVLGQQTYNPAYPSSMRKSTESNNGNGGPFDFGLSVPYDVALDSTGHRLFVADSVNNRVVVHVLDSNNDLIDLTADYVLGQADFLSGYDNFYGVAASSLNYPTSVTWDAANSRLFVSEFYNNRVLVFDLSSEITNGMSASYVLGQANFTSNSANRGGSAASNTLYNPFNTAWDSGNSRLFVSDASNNRTLVFDLSSGITNGMAASNVLGQADFTSSSANRGGSVAADTESFPVSMIWDSAGSRLFVSDRDNSRVLAYDLATIADGEPAVNVLGQADFTSSSANRGGSVAANTMYWPYGLDWDSGNSRLFVSDYLNHRVLAYDLATIADGEPAVNVLGQADFTSGSENRGGSFAGANTFYGAFSLIWDSLNSNLFVADSYNNRVLSFDLATFADGEPAVSAFGQPATVSSSSYPPTATGSSLTKRGTNGGANRLGFNGASSSVLDSSGRRLFVSDRGNSRILVYNTDSSGQPLDMIADHVLGQADFGGDIFNRGATVAANTLYEPYHVEWDSSNSRLFVADSFNHRVLVYDLSSGITDGMAASNVLGQADFTSNSANRGGSVAANTLSRPTSLQWDSANSRLFVSDAYNSRVLAYDLATIADGEPAVSVLGQPGFTSGTANNGGRSASSLYRPYGLEWDSANSRLFVSDYNNNRVLAYDLSTFTDGEAAVNVLGQADFTSGSSATTQAGMYYPIGLAWDSVNERLFVVDQLNSRILSYDLSTFTDGEAAANVLGQADFTSSGPNNYFADAGPGTLYYPYHLSLNSSATRLQIGDYYNNRILTFDVATAAGTTEATTFNRVVLSRLKAGESASFTLSFDLAHVVSSTLTVTFPAGFTVTSPGTTAGGASSSCLSNFGYTSNTITVDKTNCGGPITLGGATVTLPSTPGAYTITWVNDDPGSATIVIVSNDQITISATVAPTVSFLAVAQPAASTCANTSDLTGSDYTLALGTLNVATITESESLNADSDTVERICTQGSTNATSGMAVTVKNANGSSGLVSSSVPADTIPSSASGQLAAGTPGYGVCVRGSSLASDSGLTPTGADPTATGDFSTYECESASGNIVALTGSAQGLWSASGPTQDATAAIWVRVAISAVQPAHNDYADSLTFVATATY